MLAKKQNLNKIPKNNLREKIFDVDNIFNLPHHLEPQTMLISSQPGRDEHQIFHQVKTTHKSECQNLKNQTKTNDALVMVFFNAHSAKLCSTHFVVVVVVASHNYITL